MAVRAGRVRHWRGGAGLTQEEIFSAIFTGTPIACTADEWPRVREMIDVAIETYMRWDNPLLWGLAKQERARLSGEFGDA